jgi:hypothetical protein
MKNLYKIGKELFITSDEEIKEGDWCIDIEDSTVFKVKEQGHSGLLRSTTDSFVEDSCKKIILTTDQDLIADGVQPIDDEFLGWFVNNPSCEEVKIESWQTKGEWDLDYKIIIPKYTTSNLDNEKYKDYSVSKEEPKQIKCYCGHTITCDCSPLKETFEEVADEYFKLSHSRLVNEQQKEYERELFIAGYKLAQERMYSKEDMREAFIAGGNSQIEEDDDYGTEYDAYTVSYTHLDAADEEATV